MITSKKIVTGIGLTIIGLITSLSLFILFPKPIYSQVQCSQLSHWSNTNPSINQTHIFCGEWNSRNNRAIGFHSRPNGKNPPTVSNFQVTQTPNSQGIYGGTWTYSGQSETKFSTMFPDNCQQQQVINSIIYAATHPTTCPVNAPSWAKCGMNQPNNAAKGRYCAAKTGGIFPIAFSFLNNDKNKVNTAFPLRN